MSSSSGCAREQPHEFNPGCAREQPHASNKDARVSQPGIEKSAALLLALGEDATAAVFRYLSPLEVSRLGSAMRELDGLPRERVRAILRDYAAEAAEQTGFAADTGRFLDETLRQAVRPERAQAMLERLGAPGAQALEKLAWREPAEIAGLLEAQAPQLIAVVAAQLPRDVAAAVLELLPGKTRADTLLALAHSDTPSADMLGDLDDWLAGRAAPLARQGPRERAGHGHAGGQRRRTDSGTGTQRRGGWPDASAREDRAHHAYAGRPHPARECHRDPGIRSERRRTRPCRSAGPPGTGKGAVARRHGECLCAACDARRAACCSRRAAAGAASAFACAHAAGQPTAGDVRDR